VRATLSAGKIQVDFDGSAEAEFSKAAFEGLVEQPEISIAPAAQIHKAGIDKSLLKELPRKRKFIAHLPLIFKFRLSVNIAEFWMVVQIQSQTKTKNALTIRTYEILPPFSLFG